MPDHDDPESHYRKAAEQYADAVEADIEQRYTLDEARQQLALEECREYGHSWDVDEARTYADPTGTPLAVVCTRCRVRHHVDSEPANVDRRTLVELLDEARQLPNDSNPIIVDLQLRIYEYLQAAGLLDKGHLLRDD